MANPRAKTRFTLSLAAIAAAILFDQLAVYRAMIVPRLPQVQSVPLWMWCGQHAAEGVAVVAAGFGLRSWRSVGFYAAAAGALRVLLMFVFARTHEPGYLKAFEAPLPNVTTALLLSAVAYGILLGAGSTWSGAATRRAAGRAPRA